MPIAGFIAYKSMSDKFLLSAVKSIIFIIIGFYQIHCTNNLICILYSILQYIKIVGIIQPPKHY